MCGTYRDMKAVRESCVELVLIYSFGVLLLYCFIVCVLFLCLVLYAACIYIYIYTLTLYHLLIYTWAVLYR